VLNKDPDSQIPGFPTHPQLRATGCPSLDDAAAEDMGRTRDIMKRAKYG